MDEKVTLIKRDDLADKSLQEACEILKGKGVELTEDQLDQITGGSMGLYYDRVRCGKCGDEKFVFYPATETICDACGATIHVQWD